jgi:hypothetical protein
MPPPVRLQEIVDALELQLEDASSFLNRDTGQVAIVSDDLLRAAEESSHPGRALPAWQQPEWELAQQIVATNRFEPLPTKFDVHEWAIMRDFAYSLISQQRREDLLDSLHGAGAFRHFKSSVRRHGLEPAWFAFRTAAFQQIARDWCEEHQIAWQ